MNPNPIFASPAIPLLLMVAVMYFIVIRPQKKQQQEVAQMQKNLKKNDQVVTVGGIHATVVNVKDETVTVRADDNVRLEVDRSAIARLVKEG